MMGRRRSKNEIHATILQYIQDEVTAKPTRIMYHAGMSWKPARKALAALIKQGHIVEVKGPDKQSKRVYNMTAKGRKWLNAYNVVRGLI